MKIQVPQDGQLYDQDLWTWASRQAEALRSAASNEPGWRDRIDWENLIEEVHDMGKSEERSWKSLCEHVISHLLKIQYTQEYKTVNHWKREISTWRRKMADVLQENPGMKSRLDNFLEVAWNNGRFEAVEHFGVKGQDIPADCPWTLIEIAGYDPWKRRGKTKCPFPESVNQVWPAAIWMVLARHIKDWPPRQPSPVGSSTDHP